MSYSVHVAIKLTDATGHSVHRATIKQVEDFEMVELTPRPNLPGTCSNS